MTYAAGLIICLSFNVKNFGFSTELAVLERQQRATQKIQTFYRNQKIHELFKQINTEGTTINFKRFEDPLYVQETLSLIESLNDYSSYKDIAFVAVRCFADHSRMFDDLTYMDEILNNFKKFLERQITSDNALRRQLCCTWLTLYIPSDEMKFEKTHKLLHESMNSDYQYLRFISYQTMATILEEKGNIIQSIEILLKGLTLSKRYHAHIYAQIASLYARLPAQPRKHMFYLKRSIDVGSPLQQAQGKFEFAQLYGDKWSELYDPKYALSLYQSLLDDPSIIAFIDPYRIYTCILSIISNPFQSQECADHKRMQQICEHIYLHRAEISRDYYGEVMFQMLQYYASPISDMLDYQQNCKRVFEISHETLQDPDFPKKYKLKVRNKLSCMYQYGFGDIGNQSKALETLKLLRSEIENESERDNEIDYLLEDIKSRINFIEQRL